MVRFYLASPNSQLQAHAANGMDVLVSYALYSPWMDQYFPTYRTVLIDSGAFSELTGNAKVDVVEYVEWASQQKSCEAFAGLDDISGDWRRSLKNYKQGGFPTIHDTDPPELLDDLLPMSDWIGIGLNPPREGKEHFVRSVLDRIPEGKHVHGWALMRYTHLHGIHSVDSTNWWRDAMAIRTLPLTKHLSYGEALDIIVKRYQRLNRIKEAPIATLPLWSHDGTNG